MSTTFDYQEYLASREWALLKIQVRERSGGTCERCGKAPHQSTHHKTYARIGRERLDDLLGVCNPCHEWLSGKSDIDPVVVLASSIPPPPIKVPPVLNRRGQQVRVYLAGKIGKSDWRHLIFPELRGLVTSNDVDIEDISGGHHSYVGRRVGGIPQETEVDGLLYGGPYFVGCDHGGFHGEGSHGQGASDSDAEIPCCATQGVFRPYILGECSRLISRADVVFCWLDSADAYGTVFELGFAHHAKIPVWLAQPFGWDAAPRWWEDMWLPVHSARVVNPSNNPVDAWREFIKYGAPHLL